MALRTLLLTVLSALATSGGALRVVGSAPPWVSEVAGAAVEYRQLPAPEALRELYAGRADVALVGLGGPSAPKGVGPLEFVPVGVYAVRLAYRLPGVALNLDVGTACRIFAGEIQLWNDPEIAVLNDGARLPALPILTTARTRPNAASRAFADACVGGGWWPEKWRKSSWSAGAVNLRGTWREQRADLRATGSLGLLGPLEDAPGTQNARLRAVGGEFTEARAGLGGGELPASPLLPLPPALEQGAYPLRGVVWAVFLREQQYRGRTLNDALAVAAFVRALQAGGNDAFAPLPEASRPAVKLTFGGKGLDALTPLGPPAPP